MKDIDVQDVRDKSLKDKQITAIYDDVQNSKTAINTVLNVFAIIGVIGIIFSLALGIFFG